MSLLTSIGIGLLIGSIKFLFEDIVGFSLIIVFPLAYGFFIGFVLARLFSHFGLKNERSAVIFAILSITVAIGTFVLLDWSYIENILLGQLVAEGEDVTGSYLPFEGYIAVIGESGVNVGYFGVRGANLTGNLFYALMLFEFGLMYYFAVKNVRQAIYKKSLV